MNESWIKVNQIKPKIVADLMHCIGLYAMVRYAMTEEAVITCDERFAFFLSCVYLQEESCASVHQLQKETKDLIQRDPNISVSHYLMLLGIDYGFIINEKVGMRLKNYSEQQKKQILHQIEYLKSGLKSPLHQNLPMTLSGFEWMYKELEHLKWMEDENGDSVQFRTQIKDFYRPNYQQLIKKKQGEFNV